MRRAAARQRCGCGRENTLLMPIAACGAETVWDVRCGSCGSFRWFDARADGDFRRALAEARAAAPDDARARERETDRRFEAGLPTCGCGGAWHVVRALEAERCLGCGRALGGVPMTEGPAEDVAPLR